MNVLLAFNYILLQAKWLDIVPNSQLSLSQNGTELIIRNLTQDYYTFDCQQFDNVVERVIITVHSKLVYL